MGDTPLEELRRESADWHHCWDGDDSAPVDEGFAIDAALIAALATALAAKDEEIAALRSHQAQVKRAEQAEAELALRDRMLRDIIERIALTPERWNGWTTEEVLADLRALAEKAER